MTPIQRMAATSGTSRLLAAKLLWCAEFCIDKDYGCFGLRALFSRAGLCSLRNVRNSERVLLIKKRN